MESVTQGSTFFTRDFDVNHPSLEIDSHSLTHLHGNAVNVFCSVHFTLHTQISKRSAVIYAIFYQAPNDRESLNTA